MAHIAHRFLNHKPAAFEDEFLSPAPRLSLGFGASGLGIFPVHTASYFCGLGLPRMYRDRKLLPSKIRQGTNVVDTPLGHGDVST